jgi:hypothetical protein
VKAPKPASRGTKRPLDRVLFVRATPELLDALDRIAEQERAEHPGRTTSRSQIARELLFEASNSKLAGRKE